MYMAEQQKSMAEQPMSMTVKHMHMAKQHKSMAEEHMSMTEQHICMPKKRMSMSEKHMSSAEQQSQWLNSTCLWLKTRFIMTRISSLESVKSPLQLKELKCKVLNSQCQGEGIDDLLSRGMLLTSVTFFLLPPWQ